MFDQRTTPYAALIMRLALGILFLAHFSLKFFAFTPAGTAKFFASLGLPGWLAYVTMAVELVGAIALILGGPAGFFFTNPNGGWEFPAFWIVGLLTLALTGDGKFALKPTPVKG